MLPDGPRGVKRQFCPCNPPTGGGAGWHGREHSCLREPPFSPAVRGGRWRYLGIEKVPVLMDPSLDLVEKKLPAVVLVKVNWT